MSVMENEKSVPQEVSPLVDYLTRERRAHGHKSREIFKAEDLRASLVRKSSERIVLKGKDDKGRETVKGKAKLRYEANNLFSLSEVRAFHGRFSGDALYTRGREEAWHWDVFPPQTAREGLLAWMRPLVVALSPRIYGAFTDEDRSEVQAMVERAMADYLALNKPNG